MSAATVTPAIAHETDPVEENLMLGENHVEVHFDRRLGCGTFGDVFEATIKAGPDSGLLAVVKRAKQNPSEQESASEGVNKDGFIEGGEGIAEMCESQLEIESFMGRKTSAACPQFVPRFIGDLEAHGSRWLVWEHLQGTSLEDLFEQSSAARSLKPLADAMGVAGYEDGDWASLSELVEEIARQLFEGVWALEEAGIAHRDIKPENLLVAGQQLKLIDFGSAACMGEFPFVGYDYHLAPCDADYCPPERFIDEAHWNKYDVYSCALVLLRVLMRPFLAPSQYRAFRDLFFEMENDLDHWFSALILTDPAVQSFRARPPFGLPAQARVREYERLAGISCALQEEEVGMSLCPLHEGLTVLSDRFGFRYETLQALLAQEPHRRPSAREALFSLGS